MIKTQFYENYYKGTLELLVNQMKKINPLPINEEASVTIK